MATRVADALLALSPFSDVNTSYRLVGLKADRLARGILERGVSFGRFSTVFHEGLVQPTLWSFPGAGVVALSCRDTSLPALTGDEYAAPVSAYNVTLFTDRPLSARTAALYASRVVPAHWDGHVIYRTAECDLDGEPFTLDLCMDWLEAHLRTRWTGGNLPSEA